VVVVRHAARVGALFLSLAVVSWWARKDRHFDPRPALRHGA
jgi:hypothetical protein